jgi:hypothetical protein
MEGPLSLGLCSGGTLRSVETKKGSSRVEKTEIIDALKVVPTNYLQLLQLRLALVSKMFKLIFNFLR